MKLWLCEKELYEKEFPTETLILVTVFGKLKGPY